MPNAVWGIDIGHCSVKAVRMEKVGQAAQVSHFDVIEIEPGEDESSRPARVEAALQELIRRRAVGNEPVIVSVPGNQTFYRPFSLPAVQTKNLTELVAFEARQQIPFPINEVLWDYKLLGKGDAGETRVGLVAIRRELVDQLIQQIRSLGLKLDAIQVAPLALYNLVQHEFGGDDSWLVLDAGARVTDFVISDGDEFWFRPLPQSGNDVTRALEQKFHMTFEEAEQLKLKMGESKQKQKLFQVIEPILRNLVGDIQRTMGYYKGLRKEMSIDRILAVGGTFRLPGMTNFVQQGVGVEVNFLTRLTKTRLGPAVDAAWWQEELPSMAVALGLGLQGVGVSRAAMEFLPESLRRERILKRKQPMVAAGVGVLVAASAMGFLGVSHEKRLLRDQLADAKAKLQDVANLQSQYRKAEAPIEGKLAEAKGLASDTLRDRGWILRCLDALPRLRDEAGRPVLGSGAGEGEGGGAFVSGVRILRDPSGRDVDRDILNWYEQKTTVFERDRRVKRASPLVVLLKGEILGKLGSDRGGIPDAPLGALDRIRDAVLRSSAVRAKGQSGEVEELTGVVTQTEQQMRSGVVTFTPAGGGDSRQIALSSMERLDWFRNAKISVEFVTKVVVLVPGDVADKLRQEGQPVPMRQVVEFTVAWLYDDGKSGIPAEATGPEK